MASVYEPGRSAPDPFLVTFGGSGESAETDENGARDVSLHGEEAPAGAQVLRGRSGRQRPDAVADHREDDEDEAEHCDLCARVPLLGVDELWQEGEEEERRLRVEHVHD